MCPSALRVSSPPDPGGEGSNLHQTLPWTGGDVMENLIKIGAVVWISISPPHTIRQTNICTPIFIYIDHKIVLLYLVECNQPYQVHVLV